MSDCSTSSALFRKNETFCVLYSYIILRIVVRTLRIRWERCGPLVAHRDCSHLRLSGDLFMVRKKCSVKWLNRCRVKVIYCGKMLEAEGWEEADKRPQGPKRCILYSLPGDTIYSNILKERMRTQNRVNIQQRVRTQDRMRTQQGKDTVLSMVKKQ